MVEQVSFTREELYELVWSKAVSRVAPSLGISDVALRKKCRALGIPVPDASYWGKFHAGKSPRKHPLGAAPANTPDRITFTPSRRDRPAEVDKAMTKARGGVPSVPVATRRDPAVAKTMAKLRRASQDIQGGVKAGGEGEFNVRAHPDTLERVGNFLDTLTQAAKSRKFRLAQAREGLGLEIDGHVVGFVLSQVIRRTRHEPTEAEKDRVERWDRKHRADWDSWKGRPTIPFYDFAPTGVMSIEIGGWPRPNGVSHRFTDSSSRNIEDRIGDVMVSFAAHAAYQEVLRRDAEERRAQLELARQEQARIARLADLERSRLEYLEGKLGQFRAASELRSFLRSIENDAAVSSSPFMEWARRRLTDLETQVGGATISAETEAAEAFQNLSSPSGSVAKRV